MTTEIEKVEREQFVSFLEDAGVTVERSALPRFWKDIRDLEHKYHRNLERMEKREEEAQKQLATVRKDTAPTPDFVTRNEQDEWEAWLGRFLRKDVVNPLAEQIAALTKRIEELEARPVGLNYRGTFHPSHRYARNDGVTAAGSIWVALQDEPPKSPGEPNSGWMLAVKRGLDGRDRR